MRRGLPYRRERTFRIYVETLWLQAFDLSSGAKSKATGQEDESAIQKRESSFFFFKYKFWKSTQVWGVWGA